MLDQCQELNIKFAKLQLFTKEMVPTELRHCYIDEKRAKKIYVAGEKRETEVFFSVMYPTAIDICEAIGVKYYKIRYMDRNNLILYRKLKNVKNIRDKIIFVSCQNPKDTIFKNMAKYQNNVKFLYCVPQYPALLPQYDGAYTIHMDGISDHTTDFMLYRSALHFSRFKWFEIHIKLNDDCYESDWSKSFSELSEVLKK